MNRSLLLCLTMILAVVQPLSGGQAKAPFRLLYNSDAMNVRTCGTPGHPPSQVLTDAAIAATIDEAAEHGVDAYMLSAGWGHFPWTQGERMREHYRWWLAEEGRRPDQYGEYLLAGGDWVRVLLERCRHHGIAAFFSFRVNDVHFMEHAGTDHPRSQWASRFYTENPQFWIEPEHRSKWPAGYNSLRGMNWAEPAVREYKLAQIHELCRDYDLDGLELDFLRDHTLFRADCPEADRIELVTAFVREVRAILDRTSRDGRHRWLCARVPLDLRRWPETGLEPERLTVAGVDMLNASGWYHTVAAPELAGLRERVPGVALYQELTHSAATMWFLTERTGYGTVGHPRTWDTQFHTVANLAYARGADGVSLFNFAYYRQRYRDFEWLAREPPFHVLPRLRDPAWLSRQPQHYWLGQWNYHNQITNRPLRADQPRRFHFDVALPQAPLLGTTRLRLHTDQPIVGEPAAEFNGTVLAETDDASGFFDNPYDHMLSDAPRRRAWILPLELVREGRNELQLTLAGTGEALRVTWVDFAVPAAAQ